MGARPTRILPLETHVDHDPTVLARAPGVWSFERTHLESVRGGWLRRRPPLVLAVSSIEDLPTTGGPCRPRSLTADRARRLTRQAA
jgi:hypothetical protein